jgi:hypothetical protein
VIVRLLFGVLLLPGCASTLSAYSQPIGAIVELESGERLVTPTELSASVWPRPRQTIEVHATGYRRLETRVPYFSRGQWMIVLVPEHGPVGTWDENDLP